MSFCEMVPCGYCWALALTPFGSSGSIFTFPSLLLSWPWPLTATSVLCGPLQWQRGARGAPGWQVCFEGPGWHHGDGQLARSGAGPAWCPGGYREGELGTVSRRGRPRSGGAVPQAQFCLSSRVFMSPEDWWQEIREVVGCDLPGGMKGSFIHSFIQISVEWSVHLIFK